MKIAVTGAGGMLGHDLMRVLGRQHETVGLSRKDLDMAADLDATIAVLDRLQPDVVIHSAAYTHVDGCELNPDTAYRVNGLGARNVAVACARRRAAMVYISTDYVFNGRKSEPYVEWDAPDPINVYGRSKWLGERYVTSLLSRFYIVRTSWLYGRHGKNFVDTIVQAVRGGRPFLRVVDDQVGSPTYTSDLAQKIAELIEKERYGIYHVTNSEHCSWYEFAQCILDTADLAAEVRPIKSHEYPTPTTRPAYSVLRNYMLELERIPLLRPWHAALKDFISPG